MAKTELHMILTHHFVDPTSIEAKLYQIRPEVILSEFTPETYQLFMHMGLEVGIKLKEKYFSGVATLDDAQKKKIAEVLDIIYWTVGDIRASHKYAADHKDTCTLIYVDTDKRMDHEKIYNETMEQFNSILDSLSDEPTIEQFGQKLKKYMLEVRKSYIGELRKIAILKSQPDFGDQMYAATNIADPQRLSCEQEIADNARLAYTKNLGKKIAFPIGFIHGLATNGHKSVYSKLEDIVTKRHIAI